MNGRRSRAQRGRSFRGRPSWAIRSGEIRCRESHGTDEIKAGLPCPACGARW